VQRLGKELAAHDGLGNLGTDEDKDGEADMDGSDELQVRGAARKTLAIERRGWRVVTEADEGGKRRR